MYKGVRPLITSLRVNKSFDGETIEEKVRRMTQTKEPIKDAGSLNYTERKDGVIPDYNIRTDRMEAALDAMTAAAKSDRAKRGQRLGEKAYENMKKEEKEEFHKKYPNSEITKKALNQSKNGETESTGGTES